MIDEITVTVPIKFAIVMIGDYYHCLTKMEEKTLVKFEKAMLKQFPNKAYITYEYCDKHETELTSEHALVKYGYKQECLCTDLVLTFTD